MRLKSIELYGFKSFPEKTVLDLSGPTTAIVGPNGCGKSNVVDAVKWVIGETSMKELRSSVMQDVIFAGSEIRPPLNMAEVNVILSNNDGKGPGLFADSPELSLKRRYFRDGESEYFINNTPCRLKDIADVFMDSGVGSETYSIIEQGKVIALVSSKPEEKRLIIEEAAGILKYKTRKNSALRKMDATRQNLLRVNDILSELKRQTLSITRQAAKAERYKKLKEEFDTLDLSLQAKSFADVCSEIQNTSQSHSPLTDELAQIHAIVSKLEADIENHRLGITEEEAELEALNGEIYGKSSQIQKTQSEIELIKSEKESLAQMRLSKGIEIESLTKRIDQVQLDIRSRESEREDILKSIDALKSGIALISGAIESEKAQLIERTRAEEEYKNAIFGAVSKTAEGKNNLANIERSKREADQRILRLQREKEEIESEIGAYENNYSGLDAFKLDAINLKRELDQKYAQKLDAINELKAKSGFLSAKMRENQLVLEQAKSRLDSLVEYESQMKDFETPMKELLARSDSAESFGKVYPIADVFKVKQGYELACQAALGPKFRGVVVDSCPAKCEVVRHIKDNGLLRNVVLDKLPRHTAFKGEPDSVTAGYIGRLADLIEPAEGFEEISNILFGNYLVFKDMDSAMSFWQNNSGLMSMVTLEGDLLEPSGILESGKFTGLGGGIFERRSEISEKGTLIENLKAENERIESELNKAVESVSAMEKEAELLKEQAHSHDLRIIETEKDILRISQVLGDGRKKIEVLALEIGENEARKNSLMDEERANIDSISSNESIKADLEIKLADAKDGLIEIERRLEEKHKELMESNLSLSALTQRLDSLARDFGNLSALVATYRGDIGVKQEELAHSSDRILGLEALMTEKEGFLKGSFAELDSLKDSLQKRREDFSKRKNEILTLETRLREGKARQETLQKEINDLNLKFSELHVKRDMIKEQIKNSFNVDVEECFESLKEKIPSDENLDQIRTNRLELKEKIDSLGEVNVGAIEELKELEQRQKFLSEQKDDLENSLVNLDKMIKRINQTSKKRFREAFDSINEKFKEVFPKLFEGGKAYLMLTDEENILESGVDIVAQPPGKTLQNINLRSGGEKALTAIALIIAVFLHRPAPFCFLDEVDAPLDDANVLRFIKIIKELSDRSQFILITHNKVTMEVAETLYGVTMEEKGISKVVSVKFSDRRERRRIEDTIAA